MTAPPQQKVMDIKVVLPFTIETRGRSYEATWEKHIRVPDHPLPATIVVYVRAHSIALETRHLVWDERGHDGQPGFVLSRAPQHLVVELGKSLTADTLLAYDLNENADGWIRAESPQV
jgi:hypothetical protein